LGGVTEYNHENPRGKSDSWLRLKAGHSGVRSRSANYSITTVCNPWSYVHWSLPRDVLLSDLCYVL